MICMCKDRHEQTRGPSTRLAGQRAGCGGVHRLRHAHLGRDSRFGVRQSRITPFPCGLTSPHPSIRLEQTKNMNAVWPGRLGRMNTHLQRLSNGLSHDRAAPPTSSGFAKATKDRERLRRPALRHCRYRHDAWRRAHARRPARNCGTGRDPSRCGNRICLGNLFVMPGTRVRPSAGPSTSLVPGIHDFRQRQQARRGWPGHRRAKRRRPSDGYARP